MAWLADPGFTPGAKHLPKVLAALLAADREDARKLERVLARAGAAAGQLVQKQLPGADERARARLIGVLGRVAEGAPEFGAALLDALADSDERVRRVAEAALGKLAVPELAERLVARWPDASVLERRSLAEALGKSGSQAALTLLKGEHADDAELTRLIERARLMLERDLNRAAPSAITLDRALGVPQSLVVHCRAGLSRVLADEAKSLGQLGVVGSDRIRITHRGSLRDLLKLRTALGFGIEVPLPGTKQEGFAPRVVRALQQPDAERAVRAWTEGRARFRLDFAEGGHQRDKAWRIAAAAAEHLPWLHNDPQEAIWEVLIDTVRDVLELRPRRFEDPRFSYRSDDVRAASHPTIAAALARVAGAQEDDVVWDPFVGSGLELIERGLLGPYRELHGTDLEQSALSAAHANAQRAGIPLKLTQADARTHRVRNVSLIICNPPMGRRVARDGSLLPLLDAFLANAAANLKPGGRLVWLSPVADRTAGTARRLGFKVTKFEDVDLGGFSAQLQLCVR